MSDICAPRLAELDVVESCEGRLFVIEMEFEHGGLVKIFESPDYGDAMEALVKIAAAAGVPWRDVYSRGRACGTRRP